MFDRHVLHPERNDPGRWVRTASTLSPISLCLYLVAFPVSCLHFCSSGHFTILTTICFMGLLFLHTNVLGLGSYDIRRLHAAYAHARLVHSTATLFFLLIAWKNMARSWESLDCHMNNHLARHGPTSTLVPDIYTWQHQGQREQHKAVLLSLTVEMGGTPCLTKNAGVHELMGCFQANDGVCLVRPYAGEKRVMGLLFLNGQFNRHTCGWRKGAEYVSGRRALFSVYFFFFFFSLTTGDMEPYDVNEEIKSSFPFYCTRVDDTCVKRFITLCWRFYTRLRGC
jgi:hypothetical protein